MDNFFCKLVVINELGLHLRSAAKIVKLAEQATGSVWLKKDNFRVDAKDMFEILELNCPKKTYLTAVIDDPADKPVLARIAQLFASGFGE